MIEKVAKGIYIDSTKIEDDNFILKGGFYLSTLFGLESRSKKDMDTAIKIHV